MEDRITRAKFKGNLAGTAIDFGLIEDRKEFFEFLDEHDFVEYGRFVGQRNGPLFHVYMVNKDFNYSSSWIQRNDEVCQHKVGSHGSMLLDEEYRAIGYKSQVNIYG